MKLENETARDELGFSIGKHVLLPLSLLLLLFLAALWSGFSYTGLLSRMAEWQFAYLGEWYPMVTVLSFSALAILLWRFSGALRKFYKKRKNQWTELDERQHRVLLTRKSYAAFLILAGFSSAMVLVGFIYWLTLPGAVGKPVSLAGSNVAYLQEGAARFSGLQPVGPTARYREAVFDFGPSQYFAPVAARRNKDGVAEFYLFAELARNADRQVIDEKRIGILRRGALPGELIALYRNNGYAVTDKPSVVYLNARTSGRASIIFMLEALTLGLLALIFGLVMRRVFQRLLEDYDRDFGQPHKVAA